MAIQADATGIAGTRYASVKHDSKIRYDLTGIVRLLTYGRLLDPASKSATMAQNGKYLRPPVGSANDDSVYDALDVIDRSAAKIFRRMNTKIAQGIGRSPKVVFYDVTNFFFESFVERLRANPTGFRVTAAQSKSMRRFVKGDVIDRKTGKILDGTKLVAMIDDEKLKAFNDLFGYYEVIDKYHGFTRIEDQFREMKSTDGDIATLFRAFGVDVRARLYTKGDIRGLKSSVSPF